MTTYANSDSDTIKVNDNTSSKDTPPVDRHACKKYLEALQTQERVNAIKAGTFDCEHERPMFPPELCSIVQAMESRARNTGSAKRVQEQVSDYKKKSPAFAVLFDGESPLQGDEPRQKAKTVHGEPITPQLEHVTVDESIMPPLPENVQFAPEQSRGACKWVDEYIAFSKRWSPRSFEDFHEACAWSLLATVAKRRVFMHLGSDKKYTPLFTAVIADSTLSAKSEAAKIYIKILNKSGLGWMLGADSTTPQAMIETMCTTIAIPNDYDELEPEEQVIFQKEIAFRGQRGWFYEEFGQNMDAMMQKNGGPMSEFKGLIRRMDDCYDYYKRETVTHKKQKVQHPYLSLLACMTPLDLRPYAKKDSELWKDGFFARFAFITPTEKKGKRDRFPSGDIDRDIPTSLISTLRRWHDWLGERTIKIQPNEKAKGENKHEIIASSPVNPERECTPGEGVIDAFYAYNYALLDMVDNKQVQEQFYANYGRLHMIALRIAMLCASLENNGHIELRHWIRGQQYAEKARRGLHASWKRLNENGYAEERNSFEEKIIDYIGKQKTYVNSRMLIRSICKDETTETLQPFLEKIEKTGELVRATRDKVEKAGWSGRAPFYTVPGVEREMPCPPARKTEEQSKEKEK